MTSDGKPVSPATIGDNHKKNGENKRALLNSS